MEVLINQSEAQKPLIPQADFKLLMSDVKSGKTERYEEILKVYILQPYQHQIIQQELITKALGL